MKAVLILSLTLGCAVAMADGTQTGNTINVNVGNGCCAVKPPCKPRIKVVTRTVIQEKIVEKIVEKKVAVPVYVDRVETKTIIKRVVKHHRVSLALGVGPTRMQGPEDNGRVDLIRGPIGGAMYQYSPHGTWNFGALGTQGFKGSNNQSVLGTVGYDF